MKYKVQSLLWVCAAALAACGPVTTSTKNAKPNAVSKTETTPPVEEIKLPMRLSESYLKSLDAVPELTAKRFFTAYENLAAYGPVTENKIIDHARFQAASQRGKILSALLAYDLNGDLEITRSEVEALSMIAIRPQKTLGSRPFFNADTNRDDTLSFAETLRYSRKLYAEHSQKDMRPIESYLMLFDLNTNGVVTRTEMKVALKPYLGERDAARGGGDGAVR